MREKEKRRVVEFIWGYEGKGRTKESSKFHSNCIEFSEDRELTPQTFGQKL